MISLKRPLGLANLLAVLAVLALLTGMLTFMVWGRVSLLQKGQEVILKTAPVDPRDLLRGYYVRLTYDISRISPADLEIPPATTDWRNGFKRHSRVYVTLRPDGEGFWSPVSLHPQMPSLQDRPPRTAIIRGRIRYDSCSARAPVLTKCTISVRYGIEKFFAARNRSQKLENFGLDSPALKKLDQQIIRLQKELNQALRQAGNDTSPENRRSERRKLLDRPDLKRLQEQLRELRKERREHARKLQTERAKRFAVIVRLDRNSGEAAISGLRLDGKQIYDEPLF